MWYAIVAVVAFALGMGVMFLVNFLKRKRDEKTIADAEEQAKGIVNKAYKEAESKKREAMLEAKEEIHKERAEYEREVKERRTGAFT